MPDIFRDVYNLDLRRNVRHSPNQYCSRYKHPFSDTMEECGY